MKEITGRHVFAITAGAFAVIIAVNLTMAVKAVSTFPGLEVKNSYVASQSFDDDRAAQEALGWTADARYEDGSLVVEITDRAGRPATAEVDILVGRRTSAADDVLPELRFDGPVWSAPVPLGDGFWTVRLTATAPDGTVFRQRHGLHVGL